jgi:anti-sigma factor RsiW
VGTAAHVTMSEPFERALRAAARRGRTGGVCPEAGLLAAYADGRLPADERRQVEAHAADCPSCVQHLALLGAVVQALGPAPARGWLSRWGWMVPVATTALVVAVWTSLPDYAVQRAIDVQVRQEAPGATAVAEPPGAPAAAVEPRTSLDNEVADRDSGRALDDAASARQAPASPRAPAREALRAEPSIDLRAPQGIETERVAAPPAPMPVPYAAPEFVATEIPTPPPAPPAPAMAPVPPPPPRAVAADAAGGAVAKSTEAVRVAPGSETGGRAGTAALQADSLLHRAAGAAPEFVVETAWGDRYRLTAGRIERSREGEVTWRAIGAVGDRMLTMASCGAPARTCWAGGTDGTMLRLRGDDVRRTDLPVRARVEAITVTPEGAVTVTVDGGARFLSVDDGRSWQRQVP